MRTAVWLAAGGVGVALAACEEPRPSNASTPAPAPAPPPTASPPAPPPPPYVGLWAARADLCPQGAWVFDEDKLATAGEVACAFRAVNRTEAGFQVLATCTAEGEAKPYQFTLALAGAGERRTMTVSRGPWDGPITLIPCVG